VVDRIDSETITHSDAAQLTIRFVGFT